MTTAEIVARCIAAHDDVDFDALTKPQQLAFITRAAKLLQKVVWTDGEKA